MDPPTPSTQLSSSSITSHYHFPSPHHPRTSLTYLACHSVGKFSLKFRVFLVGFVSWEGDWLVGWILSANTEFIPETDLVFLHMIIIVVVSSRWVGLVFGGDDLIGRGQRKTSSRQSVIYSLWSSLYLFFISFRFFSKLFQMCFRRLRIL